jgi:hypothetical protein
MGMFWSLMMRMGCNNVVWGCLLLPVLLFAKRMILTCVQECNRGPEARQARLCKFAVPSSSNHDPLSRSLRRHVCTDGASRPRRLGIVEIDTTERKLVWEGSGRRDKPRRYGVEGPHVIEGRFVLLFVIMRERRWVDWAVFFGPRV